jgi:hypothetical protein
VIVSTAEHEFFGLSVCEAIAAGAFPLLPDRLSYPELLEPTPPATRKAFFYDGSAKGLADRLGELAVQLAGNDDALRAGAASARGAMRRFAWEDRAAALDDALAELAG